MLKEHNSDSIKQQNGMNVFKYQDVYIKELKKSNESNVK